MAVALVQSKDAVVGNGTDFYTSISVTLDSTATEGNLLVACCVVEKDAGSITDPAGWSQLSASIGTGVGGVIAYKVAAGNETSATFTWGTQQKWSRLWIGEFSGLDEPILDDSASDNSGATEVTSFTSGAVTPTTNQSLVVSFVGTDSSGGLGTDTSWTEVDEVFDSSRAAIGGFSGHPMLSVGWVERNNTSSITPTADWGTGSEPAVAQTAVFRSGAVPVVAWRWVGSVTSTSASVVTKLTSNSNSVRLNTYEASNIAYAATMNGDSQEHLSSSDPSLLPGSGSFTIGAWLFMRTLTSGSGLLGKYNTTGSNRSYMLYYNSGTNTYAFHTSSDGNNAITSTITGYTPTTGKWIFLSGVYNASNNTIRAVVFDSDTPSGVSSTPTAFTGPLFASPAAFYVNGRDGLSIFNSMDVDNMFIYKGKALTDGELAALYNEGTPLEYSDLSEGQKTNLSHWWGFDEDSGNNRHDDVNGVELFENGVIRRIPRVASYSTLVDQSEIKQANSENGRTVRFDVTGLDPKTYYRSYVEIDEAEDTSKPIRFRTFPVEDEPANFAFAFASCAQTGSTSNVFTRIKNRRPELFCHLGDLHYGDIDDNNIATFRNAYNSVLTSLTQSDLYSNVPIDYTWDDHDFSAGPLGGGDSDSTSVSREAACAAYRENVPHYTLPSSNGAIYHSFVFGRIRFVATDVRSERSPKANTDNSSKVIFTTEQKNWFYNQLLEAKESGQVVIWINTYAWIGATTAQADQWAGYNTARVEIANWIKNNGLQGHIAIISGDAHMIAADDGTNSDYATGGGASMPVCHAASLERTHSIKGGPYSQGTSTSGNGQYGMIIVSDNGDDSINFNYRGYTSADTALISLDFTLDVPQLPVTEYTFSGPTSGTVGVESEEFTINLGDGVLETPVTFIMSASVDSGIFSVENVELTNETRSAAFTYTPEYAGEITISVTNDGDLTPTGSNSILMTTEEAEVEDNTAIGLTAPAARGLTGEITENFVLSLNQTPEVPFKVILDDGDAKGIFIPSNVLTISSDTTNFRYKPTKDGLATITVLNTFGLTNPTPVQYESYSQTTGPVTDPKDPLATEIVFRVNLFDPSVHKLFDLAIIEYQLKQNYVYVEGVGAFKHGDEFKVYGKEAYDVKNVHIINKANPILQIVSET